jgi:hypothetical protein
LTVYNRPRAEEETVVAIRIAGDAAARVQSARREIEAVAPAVLTTDVKTFQEAMFSQGIPIAAFEAADQRA